jgi:hypothetical protein
MIDDKSITLPKMNRLVLFVSTLLAVLLLAVVAANVLASDAYDWIKKAAG